ncbi:MAG: hypothetical protein JXA90_03095, partial [Planctomycetes bacterium]|nr:hypothetical protein [Planctomycetota bacterium]
VVFADAGTVQPGGALETWFLVLRLGEPVAEAAGLLPPLALGPALACLAALLLALAASRSLRHGVALLSLRRLAPAALCATLAVSLAASFGCSSGGGGGKDPRDLQIQLAELKITDVATAAELAVDGLPIVAWPFEV